MVYALEWRNKMSSTVSGSSDVRRSEMVMPAALKAHSLDALDAGIQNVYNVFCNVILEIVATRLRSVRHFS